jgi:hypothetical protein
MYRVSPKYKDRDVKRLNSEAESSFWASQEYSHNSNLKTASQKQPYYRKELKENINPSYPRQNLK